MPSQTRENLLPVLPLRGVIVFPHMLTHFEVGRSASVLAMERALAEGQRLFLVAQRDEKEESPRLASLYRTGTVAHIRQVMKLPDGTVRLLAEGLYRARLLSLKETKPCLVARLRPVAEGPRADDAGTLALTRAARAFFERYAHISGRVSEETLDAARKTERADHLADLIAAAVLTKFEDRQRNLETVEAAARLETLCAALTRETELSAIERQVQQRLRSQLEKNQKDLFLREQIRAIQTELGEQDAGEIDTLRKKIEQVPLHEEAREKARREIDRLARLGPGSPEADVIRTYLEWILALPWGAESKDKLDLRRARRVLDADHDGLAKVKERILEYLAVSQIKGNLKGPILCLVGPPGVGKTSIARSIARALGRAFVQMSLGGIRDEAEIRGHRRTYIGAIPGRLLYGLKQAGTRNPVFLFDEIDKLSHGVQGDPAAALLEVLDGEQNAAFRDHYLELPFDLSKVLFLTTANSAEDIPAPLLDRMELIRLPGYTEEEKVLIAKHHLLPKQLITHGLKKSAVRVSGDTLQEIIAGYTREAGVRQLERMLAQIARKVAVETIEGADGGVSVRKPDLAKYLGTARFRREKTARAPEIGVARGLAYTPFGGDTLAVETTVMRGTGNLTLTGQLGDVMQESAKAAMSYVRSRADALGLSPEFHRELDTHIHVPEGGVPKDGPSAGITLTCSLVSALTGIPLRQDIAMTGEITLRGRVLPVGGVKEKLLAAHRVGIDDILLPKDNQPDLEEIPENIRKRLHVQTVETVEEALSMVLTQKPPLRKAHVSAPAEGACEVRGGQ